MVEARGNSGDPGDGPRNPFTRGLGRRHVEGVYRKSVYLVDPASSHMLVHRGETGSSWETPVSPRRPSLLMNSGSVTSGLWHKDWL